MLGLHRRQLGRSMSAHAVSGYSSRERWKEPKRPGRARGVDVRKGKLLAGDSGRKIAEVIDLRRAIYQTRLREDGRGTPASVVSEYFHVHTRYPCLCACG